MAASLALAAPLVAGPVGLTGTGALRLAAGTGRAGLGTAASTLVSASLTTAWAGTARSLAVAAVAASALAPAATAATAPPRPAGRGLGVIVVRCGLMAGGLGRPPLGEVGWLEHHDRGLERGRGYRLVGRGRRGPMGVGVS